MIEQTNATWSDLHPAIHPGTPEWAWCRVLKINIVVMTEKAILIEKFDESSTQVWLPKSACDLLPIRVFRGDRQEYHIEVRPWAYRKLREQWA